jgi:hypothetical protein
MYTSPLKLAPSAIATLAMVLVAGMTWAGGGAGSNLPKGDGRAGGYSERNANIGSAAAARRAGSRHAMNAVVVRTAAIPMKATGSSALVS